MGYSKGKDTGNAILAILSAIFAFGNDPGLQEAGNSIKDNAVIINKQN